MKGMTISRAKAQARSLKKRFGQLGLNVSDTQALEGISAVHEYQDWNRYQAYLKSIRSASQSPSGLPTIKILASPQGFGGETAIESLFCAQMAEGTSIPVIIEKLESNHSFFNDRISNDDAVSVYDFIEIPRTFSAVMEPRKIATAPKGIVIRVKLMTEPTNIDSRVFGEELMLLLECFQRYFDAELLCKVGTVFIRCLSKMFNGHFGFYEDSFPRFINEIRSNSEDAELVVHSDSDVGCQLIASEHYAAEYKCVNLDKTKSGLFTRAPIDRFDATVVTSLDIVHYCRIFRDANKKLEDVAVYIATLTTERDLDVQLRTGNKFIECLIGYFKESLAWGREADNYSGQSLRLPER